MLLVSFCAACESGESVAPADTLIVGVESSPTNLDPRYATDALSSRIGDLIFNSLARVDGHFRYLPDLAQEWEIPNATTYVFHLKKGFAFHDGAAVTAEDVKATYESILHPAHHSPKREAMKMITAIDVRDPSTVVFHLAEPHAPFMEASLVGIIPRHLAFRPTEEIGPVVIGSGPFRMAQWQPGVQAILERNPAYAEGPPRLRRIVFKVVPDGVVRVLELKKGVLQFVENAVDPDVIPWLRNQAHLDIVSFPGTSFHYLGFNLRDRRLGDLRVRQAIAHAIDRDSIVHYILQGFAQPATGLLPPSHWAYEPHVPAYSYDPAKARTLLDEAGYGDPDGAGPLPRFRLSYKTTTVELARRVAEVFQEQLAQVGIALEIRSYEWGTFYSDIKKGNFQLYALSWVGVNDPDIYYFIFHSRMIPPQGNNRGYYSNPLMDYLTETGRKVLDTERRRRIYGEIQRVAAEDLPAIPLWWTTNVVIKDKRIRGFVPYPDGNLLSLKEIEIADTE